MIVSPLLGFVTTETNPSASVGFLFLPTFGKLMLNVTDDVTARSIVIQAAENLASRFNPRVGCKRSWDRSGHLVNGVNREDMDKHFRELFAIARSNDSAHGLHRQSSSSTT